MDITITSVAKRCESHCPRTLCVCEAQQTLCNPKPIISLMDCQSFPWQQHICLILSTVVTAASLLWTEWRTSSPVYCPVQLPWQPAPSPLSGDERDCREHPALLCFPLICLQQLPPHFSSSSSVVPHFPFFFFLKFDPWPLKCLTVGINQGVGWLSCQFPRLRICQWQRCLQEAERDRSGTSRVSVWVTCEDRVEE